MRKRHETFVCRKTENTELMRCICGLCEAETLRARVRVLEGALEFYAVKRLYTNIGVQSDLYEDQGDRARQALANSRKGEADPSG